MLALEEVGKSSSFGAIFCESCGIDSGIQSTIVIDFDSIESFELSNGGSGGEASDRTIKTCGVVEWCGYRVRLICCNCGASVVGEVAQFGWVCAEVSGEAQVGDEGFLIDSSVESTTESILFDLEV